MAQFQIYNYQFGQLVNNFLKDLFENDNVLMKAEKSFPIKQELLSRFIEVDYKNQTNEKTQESDQSGKEDAKIKNAKIFFEQLSKDFLDCPIRLERQMNKQQMNAIIERIVEKV